MKFLPFFAIALFMVASGFASNGSVQVKLCGAFEKPGNYQVSQAGVHLQEIMKKVRGLPLARTDVAMVVDSSGKTRIVDLKKKSPDSIIMGGEQVYLFERIISQR